MNPLLAALLSATTLGALLVAWDLLGRMGVVAEPGRVQTAGLAIVAGAMIGMTAIVFLVVIPFLCVLLGGLALLALHYRGDGRWIELGLLLAAFGASWVIAVGWVVIPQLLVGGAVSGGWLGPTLVGVGLATLSLGIGTLLLRPGAPR